MKLSIEHETMQKEALMEQAYESNCWNPNGEPCKKCRFNGCCTIQNENRKKKLVGKLRNDRDQYPINSEYWDEIPYEETEQNETI